VARAGGTAGARDGLVQVCPRDPAMFAMATAVVTGTGIGACYLPARRAARANAAETLRG